MATQAGGIAGILTRMFSFGSSTSVGLSIGTSSIKVAELKKTGKTWQLTHFGIAPLPEESVVNREIVNQVAVMDSLRSLTRQASLKTKNVCSSLSGNSVIIKRMSVEVGKMSELEEQVFWEAEQYLPFDPSEVVMDFHIIAQEGKQVDVILVAVKRSVLESYMSCIEEAGLKPKVMDVDFLALQNAYEVAYPSASTESVALVDIGASAMKICVVYQGVPCFTKDTPMGGNNLTAAIQKHMSLSWADAEAMKTSATGNSIAQEILDLMQITAENFAIEIKRAIDFHNASSSEGQVSSILLSGGGAKIPELSRVIEDKAGLPTQILNPFNAITYDPQIFSPEYVSAIIPLSAIPIGLALRAAAQ